MCFFLSFFFIGESIVIFLHCYPLEVQEQSTSKEQGLWFTWNVNSFKWPHFQEAFFNPKAEWRKCILLFSTVFPAILWAYFKINLSAHTPTLGRALISLLIHSKKKVITADCIGPSSFLRGGGGGVNFNLKREDRRLFFILCVTSGLCLMSSLGAML